MTVGHDVGSASLRSPHNRAEAALFGKLYADMFVLAGQSTLTVRARVNVLILPGTLSPASQSRRPHSARIIPCRFWRQPRL